MFNRRFTLQADLKLEGEPSVDTLQPDCAPRLCRVSIAFQQTREHIAQFRRIDGFRQMGGLPASRLFRTSSVRACAVSAATRTLKAGLSRSMRVSLLRSGPR